LSRRGSQEHVEEFAVGRAEIPGKLRQADESRLESWRGGQRGNAKAVDLVAGAVNHPGAEGRPGLDLEAAVRDDGIDGGRSAAGDRAARQVPPVRTAQQQDLARVHRHDRNLVGVVSHANSLPHSLYIHVPFCVSKCPYCDFNSHVGLEHLFDAYNAALVSEVHAWGRELGGPRIDTVFIGGGTPSRVPGGHIVAIMEAVRRSFDLDAEAEVTLEANPHSAEAERMEAWLEAGVNRLSLGFQSLDPAALAFLERAHSGPEALEVFARARREGFRNISADLIFAIPGQSEARWREVLSEVLALGPDHVSAYELTPEVGTRLGADVAAGTTVLPSEDEQMSQYAAAEELLRAADYERYEVSNWARPGRECRHNTAYWSGVPYAAAGAGAHAYGQLPHVPSWLGDAPPGAIAARSWNIANPAGYIKAVREVGHPVGGFEWSDRPTAVGELMMMGLRREEGVNLAAASRRFGGDVAADLAAPIRRLRDAGLLYVSGENVRATDRGRLLLTSVTRELIPAAQPGA
jgi:putative oxygen-independent coproporphyrinogen III oxidase